jgi:branched-chain amino acid transport system permease protein
MDWLNAVIQDVLLGGRYALFATGLSLTFGVMRLVNIAHGDLIVLAAFPALVLAQTLSLRHLLTLVVVIPAMAAIDYVLQRWLLDRTLGADILPRLLVTFGMSVIIRKLLVEMFSADIRKLQAGALETMSVPLGGGIAVGPLPLIMLGTAIAVIGGLQLLFYRTELGRASRAVPDDRETAGLMGIGNRHLFGLALAMAVVAIAGVFLAVRTNFDRFSGPPRLLYAFEAVIIGGLGSLWGTLAGGTILGVAQSIGAQIDPGGRS